MSEEKKVVWFFVDDRLVSGEIIIEYKDKICIKTNADLYLVNTYYSSKEEAEKAQLKKLHGQLEILFEKVKTLTQKETTGSLL